MKIGERIRQVRKELGLTMQDVYLEGVKQLNNDAPSISTLQRLEQGKTCKFSTIITYASIIGVTLDVLLKDTVYEQRHLISKKERGTRYSYSAGVYTEMLTPPDVNYIVSELIMEKDGRTSWESSPENGTEYKKTILIASGLITVYLGDESFRMKFGDTFTFDSTKPHYFVNNSNGTARATIFLTPKHY